MPGEKVDLVLEGIRTAAGLERKARRGVIPGALTVSVVIPVHNDGAYLSQCVVALLDGSVCPAEIVVVDDGSEPPVDAACLPGGCRLLRRQHEGSYAARNAGVESARGDVIVFVDSDCLAHSDAVERMISALERDPELAAVFGAYDDAPGSRDFVSQFRNLLHAYTHARAREQAATFWTGCSAVRRSVFIGHGGFALDRKKLRDVELGLRMARAGRKIRLDAHVKVRHMKRWRLDRMVRTDVFDRAANWTELILRERRLPDDLNVRRAERWAVAALFAFLGAAVAALWRPEAGWAAVGLGGAYLALNAGLIGYFRRVRGASFAMRSLPLVMLYHACCAAGLAVGCTRYVLRAAR
jgi:glycosyltransferase involved in cell wall biosynthesis